MENKHNNPPEIPFLRASFPAEILKELAEVFGSDYVGAGNWVSSFESKLETYLRANSVVVTSSCTAALTLAYISAGIKRGSVVLSTPMTCAATNIPLLQMGAKIDWLDVDPLSGNVTVESVIVGFHRQPGAQAVVIMDWGGVPCEYPAIVAECRRQDVPLILDAAQSFGSSYAGERYPCQVDYVCYSFGPTKLLSAVEGGAVATSVRQRSERIRDLRWYGIRRESRDQWRFWEYFVEELGYRFVSNNVFAAIGSQMLSRIEGRLTHHRELAQAYDTLLAKVPGLRLGKRPICSEPNFWLYTVLVEERERLLSKLRTHGVQAATPHKRNDHMLSNWNELPTSESLDGVEEFNQRYLCLPIGPWMHLPEVEKVCQLISSGW
jgi:perosamine synthetase